MHLTPLRGPRSEAFCSVISCHLSLPSISAAQVMPKALGRNLVRTSTFHTNQLQVYFLL
jgi:hypothetical protein